MTQTPTNHSVTQSRPHHGHFAAAPREGPSAADPGSTTGLLDGMEWSATALGARSTWPMELEAAIRTVLASRLPVLGGGIRPDLQRRVPAHSWKQTPGRFRSAGSALLARGVADAGAGPEQYSDRPPAFPSARAAIAVHRPARLSRRDLLDPVRIHRSPMPTAGELGDSGRRRTPGPPKSSASARCGLFTIWAACPAPVPPTQRMRAGWCSTRSPATEPTYPSAPCISSSTTNRCGCVLCTDSCRVDRCHRARTPTRSG